MAAWVPIVPDPWDGSVALILGHGAGQGMNSPFMTFFHTELAGRGLLSVKFNFDYMDDRRKLPDPQPKLQATYKNVIRAVNEGHRPRGIVIGGKSMGGRVASYVARDIPEVKGLLFLGYPLHPPGRPEQLRDAHLYEIGKPMLFISGARDSFATKSLLDTVISRLGSLATMVWIENGDHSLKVGKSLPGSLGHVVDTIDHWVKRVIHD